MPYDYTGDRDDVYTGDPRRCPRHPHVATSSPDGMFDAPCGACEYEMDEREEERHEQERALAEDTEPPKFVRNGHKVDLKWHPIDNFYRCRRCGREDWTGDEEWSEPCPGEPPPLALPPEDDDIPF